MADVRKSRLRAVKFSAQFIGLVVGVGLTISSCVGHTSFIQQAFGTVHSAIGAEWVFLTFLIVHWFRVWFGIQFIEESYDSTFGAALTKQNGHSSENTNEVRERHDLIIFILMVCLTLNAAMMAGKIGGVAGMNILLALQAICVVTYDAVYWRALTQQGPEFAANRFIVIGDMVTCAMIFAVVATSTVALLGSPLDQHYVTALFLFLTGGLMVVFGGELWSQYGPATLSILRSLTETGDTSA